MLILRLQEFLASCWYKSLPVPDQINAFHVCLCFCLLQLKFLALVDLLDQGNVLRLDRVQRPGRVHDRDPIAVVQADGVAQLVLNRVDDPGLGVVVVAAISNL